MISSELFRRYLHKPSVQEWIIAHTVKSIIIATIRSTAKKPIKCTYHNNTIFVTHIDHEDKLVLFLHKGMIISKAEKKLLEKFTISTTIKDIIILWS